MLFLKTLGGLSVDADGAPATGAAQQRKTLALLALVAAAGRRGVSRDKLAAYLWPESDAEHARQLLKQACYALRRDLHAHELFLGTHELRLNPNVITSDVASLQDALDRGDLAGAVAAHTGPFLDGFYLAGAGEFERWVEGTRAALQGRVAEALESLATHATSAGDPFAAVKWWRRLSALDPLSSHAALGLMRALIAAGERAAALESGRVHAELVRQELGTAQDAAVTEFLERLREEGKDCAAPWIGTEEESGQSAAPSAPGALDIPGAATTQARRQPARIGRPLAIAAATLALAASVLVVGHRNPTRFDANLLAVAPFSVPDPELEFWHEGLVDLMSRNLDGAGPLRTVPPSDVIRRWQGRGDRASARDLGGRTGAGVVVFGQLLRAGPDSLRVKAAVLDVRKDRALAEIDRAERADRIDLLADSLTLDVIRALTPPSPQIPLTAASAEPHRPISFVGTKSLPALKAFLQGERYLRRFALDSAIASYDRAITLDTTFALALHAMGRARAWNLLGGDPYFARAGLHNHGLSARDSLMIASDSQLVALHAWTFRPLVLRKLRILEEAVRRYPEDPEAWFELGDLRFHLGFFFRNTWNDARAAFDRAIALDSSFALAYVHPVEIALTDNDPEAALRYVRGYLAIPSVNPDGAGMHLLSRLLDRERSRSPDLGDELERASLPALRRLAFATRAWPDPEETQIVVARQLLASAEASLRGVPDDPEYSLRPYRSLLAQALIFRGHLREARGVVGNRFAMPAFMELAELGAIPREVVEAAVVGWLRDPDTSGDHVLFPWFTEGRCYRTLDAALWWASQNDTANLRRLVEREELAARTADTVSAPLYWRPAPEFARAALALAHGDTVSALSRFVAVHSAWCPDAGQLRQARFRLLAAGGRDREAAEVFDASYERRVPMMLERARLAERLGDRPTAIHYYRFVVQAWLHADPELQPVVAEVRGALHRLGGTPRR